MTSRPNIIVILADDLGFSDLGCYGGEIDTPSLDRLASQGVANDSFSVTPRCSPSRAMLLTGRQPHSVGIGVLTKDTRPNGYAGSLDPTVPTIAQRLREAGYATALAGKWHLSADFDAPDDTWPTRRGFDEFYGILPGCCSYYAPPLMIGEERADAALTAGEDYYFTDDLSRFSADFLRRSADAGTPFFLYAAYTAPHWPLHAREEDVAKYRERYAAGWDELRAARHARQGHLRLALDGLSARDPEVPAWDAVEDKRWEIERMAVYAAQVEALDRGVGLLLRTLDELGIAEDTLVLFSSDNGACEEHLPAGLPVKPFRDDVCPSRTRDGRRVRLGDSPEIDPGPEDSYVSYGRAWANLSNTPFRLYKRWVHEGGISSPLLARWPGGGIDSGRRDERPLHLLDVFPTLLEAAGLPHDGTLGVSMLPVLRGEEPEERERWLFWEHVGNAAVRHGDWKLVREYGRDWELYDLANDRAESDDLAAAHPELVRRLAGRWEEWARENGVIPWDAVLADFRARGVPEWRAYG